MRSVNQETGGLSFLADVRFFHTAGLPVQLLLQIFWPVPDQSSQIRTWPVLAVTPNVSADPGYPGTDS